LISVSFINFTTWNNILNNTTQVQVQLQNLHDSRCITSIMTSKYHCNFTVGTAHGASNYLLQVDISVISL